ncbi:putative RING finger protein 10 [Cocos nucifera]|uniref:Putative RING finger protein 10 n=2 Tax=Magnoliopsida TaxID=3398 RepID=A0A8K0IY43_COCNU|nr:putative RING finger protein 10 [Cocos nucifera]
MAPLPTLAALPGSKQRASLPTVAADRPRSPPRTRQTAPVPRVPIQRFQYLETPVIHPIREVGRKEIRVKRKSMVGAPFSGRGNWVIGFRVLDTKEVSCGQNGGTILECQPAGSEGTTSQFRPNQFGPAQINGRSSGSDHLAADTLGTHGSTAHSAARRNQVVSANHLLNFYYDPISRPQPRLPPPRRQQKIKPYNKDLFLQANYKFVVLDTGCYEVESTDPDKMLRWENVICVRFSTPIPVQCPICLESPLCPQITSCGHIYCFPCILRYLLMGEEDHRGECWKKCPLCFMMISTKDLYTILVENVKQFQVGDHAYFTLLTRPKDSLVPILKNQQVEGPMPCSSDGICDPFSKFVLTSDVELSVREAKSDLNNWLHKADCGLVDDLEILPYVCAALEHLEERMKNWMECVTYNSSPSLRNSASSAHNPKIRHNKAQPQAFNRSSDIAKLDAWESTGRSITLDHEMTESSPKSGADSSPVPLAAVPEAFENSEKVMLSYIDGKALHQTSSSCKGAKQKESYTFYQEQKEMAQMCSHLKNVLLSGKILELETVTQTEAMRRRYRYLSHFSLTTTFQLCEIDLSDILPPGSLAPFMDELKKREKQRKRLARKEQEERLKAEAASLHANLITHDKGQYSPKNVTFSSDDFEALGGCSAPSTSPPVTGERKLFSDVTRLGFAAAHDSPSLRAEERTDSSGNMERMGEASSIQGQRDMLYNQTFNLDQVSFAAEGIKDAQQTMSALKSANKELKGMMKTVKIQDIDSMQDEMMDLMDMSTEIQESLGRSYNVPDDIDEDELLGELDALEADMGAETESDAVPSYLQPDKESDLDAELSLPAAPTGHAAVPPNRQNPQVCPLTLS